MTHNVTRRRAPPSADPSLREAKAFFREYLKSGAKRALFSCVADKPDGSVGDETSRRTYFAPDSTAFAMARELATMEGRRRPQKVIFPAFELGRRGEAFASPSPSIQSDLQLTVTVDPNGSQRPQEHQFQLQGKAITPALGYVRQTWSTKPFSFDANGEAMVAAKIRSEAVASFSGPAEPMPEQDVVLRCKVE